jgi:signal transduction histidine kinase
LTRKKFTLRFQLIVTFVICILISSFTVLTIDFAMRSTHKVAFTSYESSKNDVEARMEFLKEEFPGRINAYSLKAVVEEASGNDKYKVYVADESGKVLFHSENATDTQLNIKDIYKAISDPTSPYEGKPYVLVESEGWQGRPVFLIVEGQLRGEEGYFYEQQTARNFIVFLIVFAFSFYMFTSSKMKRIQQINSNLNEIAHGNLAVRLNTRDKDELDIVSQNINTMAENLERQLKKERQIEKSKMELITGVSHDLRTPLTSIIGYLNLLKNKSYLDEAEHDRFVQNTYNKTLQLKKLIDDLFEYTRLTSGDIKLNLHQFDMMELIQQMLSEYEPIAQDKGVFIRKQIESKSVPIYADSEKVMRAIDNLLMNALKFSNNPGEVFVDVSTYPSHVSIRIENQGKPISKEQEEHLFDRFYKADDSRAAGALQDGSGLGLSITKQIIEIHGGTIRLEHREGYFTFTIDLPRQQ